MLVCSLRPNIFLNSISRLLIIYCDKNVSVFLFKNKKISNKSKHLKIKYLTVKDFVKKGNIVIKYINTNFMLADPLTKGLRSIAFKQHIENTSILELFDTLD